MVLLSPAYTDVVPLVLVREAYCHTADRRVSFAPLLKYKGFTAAQNLSVNIASGLCRRVKLLFRSPYTPALVTRHDKDSLCSRIDDTNNASEAGSAPAKTGLPIRACFVQEANIILLVWCLVN